MSRGSFSKRSGSPSAAGPPGGPNFVIVVPDAATLGAFPDAGLPNNEPAWVASFDDGWTLRRDSVAVPDGILVVAASSGVGNWERNQIPAYKWMTQPTWFIDPAAGNDEADGAAALTALKTRAELRRRVGRIPLVDLDITWLGGSAEDVYWDFAGEHFVLEHGVTTNLFSGTITNPPQNWSAGARTDAQIRSSSLGIGNSWTSLGLLHKFGRLTSGASSGMTFIVCADLNDFTARVSVPCDVPGFTFAEGSYANGVTFTIFDVPTMTGRWLWSEDALTGDHAFENLRFGADGTDVASQINFTFASFFLNCAFNGHIVFGQPQYIGCYMRKWMLVSDSAATLQASCIEDVVSLDRAVLATRSSFVQNSASFGLDLKHEASFVVYASFFAHVADNSGMRLRENSNATVRDGFDYFGVGNTTANIGVDVGANCNFGFDRNHVPNFGAVGVSQSFVGGLPKTFGEWPYQNIQANSAAVFNVGDSPIDEFAMVTADQTTASGVYVPMPQQSISFTILGARRIDADFKGQIAAGAGARPSLAIFVDGVQATAGAGAIALGPDGIALSFRVSLNAGGHTIEMRWRDAAGAGTGIFCRPVTNPDLESASLRVRQALV